MSTKAIEVWWAKAGQLDTSIISESERRRAQDFHQDRDRSLHATSYALRRMILANKTGLAPHILRFESYCVTCGRGDHGAPKLSAGQSLNISFSVSHSADVALIAVARGIQLGADIERTIAPSAWHELQPNILNANDDNSLGRERYWTAKEAALKCTRYGLAIPPNAVTLKREGPHTGRALIDHALCRTELCVTWFDVEAAYTGAIASQGRAAVELRRAPITVPDIGSVVRLDHNPT